MFVDRCLIFYLCVLQWLLNDIGELVGRDHLLVYSIAVGIDCRFAVVDASATDEVLLIFYGS